MMDVEGLLHTEKFLLFERDKYKVDQIVQLYYIIDITGILPLMSIGITLWFNYRENRINRYVR